MAPQEISVPDAVSEGTKAIVEDQEVTVAIEGATNLPTTTSTKDTTLVVANCQD